MLLAKDKISEASSQVLPQAKDADDTVLRRASQPVNDQDSGVLKEGLARLATGVSPTASSAAATAPGKGRKS